MRINLKSVQMDHHSKAKELLQQRDELDGKIKELMLVLETVSGGDIRRNL